MNKDLIAEKKAEFEESKKEALARKETIWKGMHDVAITFSLGALARGS